MSWGMFALGLARRIVTALVVSLVVLVFGAVEVAARAEVAAAVFRPPWYAPVRVLSALIGLIRGHADVVAIVFALVVLAVVVMVAVRHIRTNKPPRAVVACVAFGIPVWAVFQVAKTKTG